MAPDAGALAAQRARRRDIDALRFFAVLVQFPYHAGLVFAVDSLYHVKNATLSPAITLVTDFMHQWRMPLLMLVAGWSTATFYTRRAGAGFLRQRTARLLPPLIIGVIVFCPLIKWLELLGGFDIRASGVRPADANGFLANPLRFYRNLSQFSWSHMWFLAYLLLFTFLYQPLIGVVRRAPLPAEVPRAWTYLPFAAFAALEAALRPAWGDFPNFYGDWANLAVYSLAFLAGYALALHPQLERRIDEEWIKLGAIGIAAYAIQLAVPDGALHAALRGVIAWGCTAALLGAFRGFTFPRSALFDRVVEASLPIYVLHHLPVVAAAFWVTRLDLPIAVKLALILALSAAATAALYLVAVRPFAVMRRAFGMKPGRAVTR